MNRMRWLATAAALLLLLTGPRDGARAQTAYQIEAKDELKIEIWEKPDLTRTVAVRADGTVTLPLVGEVKVAGSTPAQLEEELARKFSLYDRQITQVSLEVTAYNSKAVYVLGEVAQPGKYQRWPMPTVWDVIRDAGGPNENAYLGGVQVIRKGNTTNERNIITVDLNQIWGRGVPQDLPALEPDDTIVVPKKVTEQTWPNVIYVFGAVAKPGVYQKESAVDLVGALLLAGGPVGGADLKKVVIVRKGPASPRTIEVDLNDFLKRGEEVANPVLIAGDTVTVPGGRTSVWAVIRNVAAFTTLVLGVVYLIQNISN